MHDETIGAENCLDPPAGTPRIVPAAEVAVYAGKVPARLQPAARQVASGAAAGPAAIAATLLQQPTAPRGVGGEYAIKIGIIGGSGLDDPAIMEGAREIEVCTPYGKPSDSLLEGVIAGVPCVILARHGRQHTIMPTNVPYQANIYALKAAGCTHLVVSTAVGILTEDIAPGELCLLDQYIDRTTKRPQTFYDGAAGHPPGVCHIPQGDPFCAETRATVLETAAGLGLKMHPTSTIVTIEGPRFSSRAESNFFRLLGADLVNMTIGTECPLAAEAGLSYCAIAMATDYDCWKEDEQAVTVDAVMAVMAK